MNESINDKGVYRTALATRGLVNRYVYIHKCILPWYILVSMKTCVITEGIEQSHTSEKQCRLFIGFLN